MKTKVEKVYKTTDNTILIVTATIEDGHVSVTANEIQPLSMDDAKARNRECLEDGELWRMAVESKNTELGLEDWIDYVIDIDGETGQIDNSLYPKKVEVEGIDYIFDSRAFGCMHDAIKECTDEFDALIKLHLKKPTKKAKDIINTMQDDDIDAKVKEFTTEIIEETV